MEKAKIRLKEKPPERFHVRITGGRVVVLSNYHAEPVFDGTEQEAGRLLALAAAFRVQREGD